MSQDGVGYGFALGVVFTVAMTAVAVGLCILAATRDRSRYEETSGTYDEGTDDERV